MLHRNRHVPSVPPQLEAISSEVHAKFTLSVIVTGQELCSRPIKKACPGHTLKPDVIGSDVRLEIRRSQSRSQLCPSLHRSHPERERTTQASAHPPQSSNLPGNREGAAAGPGAGSYGDVSSPGGDGNREPSMSDYLHFGRLIGERPEAVQEQLQATSIAVDRDEEAESYMEK